MYTTALAAFAVDVSLFYFTVEPLGVAGQYLARAAAAGAIAAILIARGRATRRDLGLSLDEFLADAAWLAKVVLILLGLSLALMAAAVAILRLTHPPLTEWPLELRDSATGRFGASQLPGYFLNALLLAPLVEEFVYRGILVPGLRSSYGPRATIVLGAAIFYALHLVYGYRLWQVHYFVAGAILTWAFLKRGKLWICVVLHAGGNVMVILDDLLLMWAPDAFRAIVGDTPAL
ncbi:MAG: CPBP family intramembrane metalloprotease [Planctomycetes bacterium]|nr:CPBP family intramembrane metalloprotease [Planctomycetota bacterium]